MSLVSQMWPPGGPTMGLQTACIDGSIVATGCCHPVFRLGWEPCRRLREEPILPLGATGLASWGTAKPPDWDVCARHQVSSS